MEPVFAQARWKVEGQAIFKTSPPMVLAALDGRGIAFLPEDEFTAHLAEGRVIRVLEDWCPPFPGFHLYTPSRRHPSPAFSLVLEARAFSCVGGAAKWV